MAQCKECGDVFGVMDMKDGVCKYCITGEEKPTVPIKTLKIYLTDDERAKIIEEETLRDSIRYENASGGAIDTISNISRVIFIVMLLGGLVLVVFGFFAGMK